MSKKALVLLAPLFASLFSLSVASAETCSAAALKAGADALRLQAQTAQSQAEHFRGKARENRQDIERYQKILDDCANHTAPESQCSASYLDSVRKGDLVIANAALKSNNFRVKKEEDNVKTFNKQASDLEASAAACPNP